MAHSCPDCGSTCYCNGDIDDLLLDDDDDVNACTHYLQRECDGFERDEDEDEDESDLGEDY
jgi:hypothetical protein